MSRPARLCPSQRTTPQIFSAVSLCSFSAALLFAIITYSMVGLRLGIDKFFIYTVCIFCVQLAAEGLAYIVSAFAKDPQQAGAIAPAFM